MRVRFVWVGGISLLAAALALASGSAAEDAETNAAINSVADLLQKGDIDGAKKAAAEVAKKSDLESVMHGFKLRSKKGIGVGDKPGVAAPDGIELKINAIARDGITAASLKKESEALTKAGYVTAAIAHIAHAKAPEKDDGKKKKADWNEWSEGMQKSAVEFALAAKAGDAPSLRKAANKVKQSCDTCHMVFKN